MQKKLEKKRKREIHGKVLYRNFAELVLVGSITGCMAGIIVTTFNILVHHAEEISKHSYGLVRENLWFLPLLLLALLASAFLISVAVNMSSVIRGCGIPQAEGATRGIVPLKWWRDMALMFATSLLSIFMGLSVGAEGPSVLIGACAGDGVSAVLRRNQMIRKFQATGGACAGLAVASNAPLTGIAFAFEEAYKRLTPEVLICSFSSVILAMLTRSTIYTALGMEIENAFSTYAFSDLPYKAYGFVALSGLACGLLGVGFYKFTFLMRKLFKKVRVKNQKITYGLRILIAVLIGGAFCMVSDGVMGGGHHLIASLGSKFEGNPQAVFGMGVVGTLSVILILKLTSTSVNIGSGIPCGAFIPIIAVGACLGALLNQIWTKIDPDMALHGDLMIMMCMSAFFVAVVKAPITSIVMICEFTGSISYLLPVIIAVFIGYFVAEMFRTDGIYEELLEQYEHETGIHERAVREVFEMMVEEGSLADKREVRDVLWPVGARVTQIRRGDEVILPSGDTVLHAGDNLTVVCKTDDGKKTRDDLSHLLGMELGENPQENPLSTIE